MNKMLKTLRNTTPWLMLLLCISLIGCAKKPSLSMSEVDKKASQTPYKKSVCQSPLFKTKDRANQPLIFSPFRTSEEVLTVWVAPYQTQDGTYHEAKRLHFSVTPSTWLNTIYELNHEDES